jgi:hypothetical protein
VGTVGRREAFTQVAGDLRRLVAQALSANGVALLAALLFQDHCSISRIRGPNATCGA